MLALAQTGIAVVAGAQTPVRRIGNDSVVVIAGEAYEAGSLDRKLLGNNYRFEWTTPITVPVVDLKTLHGGLHPTKEGGGMGAVARMQGGARQLGIRLPDGLKDPPDSGPE